MKKTDIPDCEEAQKELGTDLAKCTERILTADFNKAIEEESDEFERPTGDDEVLADDISLIYFTSGTSGLPKMVVTNKLSGLDTSPTAKYWHKVEEDGIHHTAADTGWGKAVWGNFYGQWIAGSAVFIYDYDRFNGIKLLEKVIENKVNTFRAPPTIYRFLIKENISDMTFQTYIM